MARNMVVVCLCCIGTVVCVPQVGFGVGLGTDFTYQGRFIENGSPAEGNYDFQFRLYDAAVGGAQLGSQIAKPSTSVTDGYFTVDLDFGDQFNGDARWIEIDVRPAGSGSYSVLAPRQKLTATPYAMHAADGGGSGGISGSGTAGYLAKFTGTGSIGNSAMHESGGKFGIGTTTPTEKLVVADVTNTRLLVDASGGTGQAAVVLKAGSGANNRAARIDLYNAASGSSYPQWTILNDFNQDGTNDLSIVNNTPSNQVIVARQDGKVGIGTATATEKLHVIGNVKALDYLYGSDERLKTNIRPLNDILDRLSSVRAVAFQWSPEAVEKAGAVAGRTHLGVLADEVEGVFPEIVSSPQDGYKAISYSGLTAVLLEAVKELKAENDALRQRIDALEREVK